MEEVKSIGSAKKVRALFISEKRPLTLAEINKAYPELQATQISMALCYLMRNRYLSREQMPSDKVRGRKNIFVYTYHESRLPKEVINAN